MKVEQKKEIEAIVFDLGNVIFDISFEEMYDYWAKLKGYNKAELKRRLFFDEMYCRFERGEIEPNTYRDYAIEKLGFKMSYEEFDRGWNSIYMETKTGMEELISNLEGRYPLYVLTNTNELHADIWRVKYDEILRHFDRVFSSYELGARKPEPEVYERFMKRANVEPQKTIFFDDDKENVKAAGSLGIIGIKIDSCHDIIRELQNTGICL
jgi:epoxide hydrolase-like predicted phosphatase